MSETLSTVPDGVVLASDSQMLKGIMANETQWIHAHIVTREYGGPEEGGWWYNHANLVDTVPLIFPREFTTEQCLAHAKQIQEFLVIRHRHEVWGRIYSVTGGQELHITISGKKGRSWPEQRPHYE